MRPLLIGRGFVILLFIPLHDSKHPISAVTDQPQPLASPPGESPIKTPDWVKHAVFYQVFPDRFARSSRIKHLPGLKFKTWGSESIHDGFQG
jgi:hypothetical protein